MPFSEITYKKIKWAFIAFLSAAVIIYLSIIFSDLIVMLTVSILATMVFNPVVSMLERNGLHRIISILVVFFAVGVLIFTGFSFLIPKIIRQLNNLTASYTQENLQLLVAEVEKTVKSLVPFVNSVNLAERLNQMFVNLANDFINNISNIVTSIFSILAILIIVPFLTFFLLKDGARLLKGIVNVMPNKYFEVAYWVLRKIGVQLSRYVRGWIFDAFIVGTLAALGLAMLGIENSISIGFIAGLGHLIPYFGPVIGGIPAIIISLMQFGDLSMLPQITILFILIYTFDNGFIQPNIYSKSTDMHPITIIILILMGSQVLGIFGMLLAVPTATVVKTAAREIYLGYKNYKILRA